MLNSDFGKPQDDVAVYEYTDIPMTVSLSTYVYKFKPWNNDTRYLYPPEKMQKEIDDLNLLMKSMVPWTSTLFMSTISCTLMFLGFCGLITFFHFKKDVDTSFIFACIFLGSFIHYFISLVFRYLITKSVIMSVESRIRELNEKYDADKIYFKLINLSEFGFKYLKFHWGQNNTIHYALRVVYKYCVII
ncbi:conserved Plasmodium protein, unknown function [Plasmodium knowlesi strain H]|uniref:Uncharacterized protein n=3 Tax=Plasmodium knowlesi TaxID=5850 RepID=A0A5K1UT42_PLAKH|nr:conserved Plasmodium protein, unknown function [Plasmodium knowlesi strain H]OTN65867.1 Uncharacterized protein PKNOH_S100060500 [Plasmodium knowlesi]CAA9987958.1 conserved Plasmodium protein, unknown function [Plasmodium knowlesi strain H]SBO22157.1 conserved Plasmodium protein, unknown function [Plasmodium knowlesi strain H]SBO29184.1 conserved Plasmodium protein, unknown function [Plasmodium knowlesi strain H]VVS77432.1 conserved Plasmodium protein, unknown function [Plasmodium knowlesi |eukprot:XP_002258937.1 hypothetical protein, conserved in Plasmodium species [Plasmodium knowlesi strain H]